MHVLLIYISVIMIINYISSFKVENIKVENIEDLSDWCLRGRIINFYLTTGVGLSDISVAMIANENNTNCTLIYTVKPKQNIMLVLEFPDLRPNESLCITKQNNSVTVRNFVKTEMCQYNVFRPIYSSKSEEKMIIKFRNEGEMSTIKITVTSMRNSHGTCFNTNETECLVDGKIFCMTQKVACDGHNNCGIPELYDEDKKKCEGPKLTFIMIFFSLLMGAMSIFLFVSFCLTFLPKRKEIFVYKFDQTMPLFDSEGGITNAEIEIQVLYPKETKAGPIDDTKLI